jgi:hypothetical protein
MAGSDALKRGGGRLLSRPFAVIVTLDLERGSRIVGPRKARVAGDSSSRHRAARRAVGDRRRTQSLWMKKGMAI